MHINIFLYASVNLRPGLWSCAMEKEKSPPLSETLHDRIKLIRQTLGLSQRKMAECIGCHYITWQTYENGKSIIGGAMLAELVRLGFNANWILTGTGAMKIKDGERNCLDPEFLTRVISEAQKWQEHENIILPPEKQALIYVMLYDFCKNNPDLLKSETLRNFYALPA